MLWILLSVVIILALILGVEILQKDDNFDKIPGPLGLPIVGNGFDFMQDQVKTFYHIRYLANKYKDLFKLKMGPMRNCAIYNPEDIEALISGSKYNCKSFLYKFLKPWLQEGLLLSDGEKWRQRRKILTPAFHFNILRHFNLILVEKCVTLVEEIESQVNAAKTDIFPLISDFTLSSLCETAMGHKLDQETSDNAKKYKGAIHKLGLYILYRTQRVWLYSNFVFNLTPLARKQNKLLNILSSFRNKVIDERSKSSDFKIIAETENYTEQDSIMPFGKKRLAMLDLLHRSKEEGVIDKKGICEEIDTFMFEGYDTTAAALQFIFMLLANNQEAQEKIVQECSEVLGTSGQTPTMSDLEHMKYLECCIKEGLRLYPPVPFFSRRCHQPLKLRNYELPAGTDVTVLVYDLHRRGDIFPDPTAFRPDRFMGESRGWHQFAYIPFSGGPRNCIGQKFAMMEMKLAVSSVLRRFRVLPITKPQDIVFVSDFILRSRDPIYVKFQNRS